jgi:cytochrome b
VRDADDGAATRAIVVWDVPTRLFHWALALLIPFMWWSSTSERMAWHKLGGFAVVALLVFRTAWGVFGSQTARFKNFIRGPGFVWRYLRGKADAAIGHNPLGGWSIAAMLMLVSAEAGLGLVALDEDGLESGPLAAFAGFDGARLASHWHAVIFDWLVLLIALHIGAVFAYLAFGKNLIGPMLTGRKRFAAPIDAPTMAPLWRFAVAVTLAGGAFYALLRLDN